MRHVIDRTAQSYLIAQLQDVAAGIWDARGQHRRGARGPAVQFLVTGLRRVRYILEKFEDDLKPGDVILSNDPYQGALQPPARLGLLPAGLLRGRAAVLHPHARPQLDTGGAFPGGYFPNGYDIHAEGL